MRLVAIALIAGCSSMPDVNGNTLGESGQAQLSVSPDKQTVNALGADLTVTNTGDRASGAIGARLVDDDASAFRIEHSDCTVLQPGGACTIHIELSAVATGKTTLEIDEDNEPKTSAELDGVLVPAIKWKDDATQFSAQDCTVAGPNEQIRATLQLRYFDVAIQTVQLKSSDNHYAITNNTCAMQTNNAGTCSIDLVVNRGAMGSAPLPQTTILATLGSLVDATTASYALAPCDLVLTPDPVMLDATIPGGGTVTLLNQSTVNSHTLASTVLDNAPDVNVPTSSCKQGLVLPPGGSCTANFVYAPSGMPQNDKTVLDYVVTTSDNMPEPLKVTGTVVVSPADSHFHFDQKKYAWDSVNLGSAPSAKTLKVLLESGQPMAGPLTITLTNPTAWQLENAMDGTCATVFTNGCQFQLDFIASQMAGNDTGIIRATDLNGGVAFAVLTAKVQ